MRQKAVDKTSEARIDFGNNKVRREQYFLKQEIDSNTGNRLINSKPEFLERKVELDDSIKMSKA